MKRNTGITLIALVVTIVVLIILASISITVIKENGIILNAKQAKFMTEVREIKEQVEVEEVRNDDKKNLSFGTIKEVTGLDTQYNAMLAIENGILVYEPEKVDKDQKQWLEQMNIYEKQEWIPIYTAEQLQKIASVEKIAIEETGGLEFTFYKDGKYLIQNDIDLKGSETNLWTPIQEFNGIIEGQNHNIKNLYAILNANSGGFIRILNGSIKNLKFDISVSLNYNSAGLCNSNNGTIENCIVKGNIKAIGEMHSLGGLVRINKGTISNCGNEININTSAQFAAGITIENSGTVINCYNKGTFTSCNGRAGIVGENLENGIIKNCCNFADLTLYQHQYVGGGISYRNWGIIDDCYNVGHITCGAHSIGGIVGINYNILLNCYNIGNVITSNDTNIGGIVGVNNGNMSNCYYLSTTANNAYGSSSTRTATNVEAKSPEEMKKLEFLNLINSENNWKQDGSNINNGYPILKCSKKE